MEIILDQDGSREQHEPKMIGPKTRFNQTADIKVAKSIGFCISIVCSHDINHNTQQDEDKTDQEGST